ncbi:MAG: hypothetical protein ACI4RA_01980 [Kiritimatiellia bacterium]
MSRLFLFVAFTAVCATVCRADTAAAGSDADEYEEVVVRRKKKKAPVTTVQINVALPSTAEAAPEAPASSVAEPPPPPEPPAAEAAEPRRLVRYFCKMWKDEDWERLWWAMSPKYRRLVSLKKFTELFTDDAEANGGLKDENILGEAETNAGIGVTVELTFKFKRAKHRVVKAEVERIPGGQYRIVKSAIIPTDLNDL